MTLDAVLAAGITIWPEPAVESSPDPALDETRLGWSVRFAFGASFLVDDTFIVFVSLGYGASTSHGDEVTATHDAMLLSTGLRVRF